MLKVTMTGNERRVLRMEGKINEACDLEMLTYPRSDAIEIDLIGVTGINSVGIRMFKDFAWRLRSATLNFSYVPRVFVDQINMVSGFLPPHALVISFYVPYFSETSNEEKIVLFNRGEHFNVQAGKPSIKWPEIVDSQGVEMEPDVVAEKYFQFLAKH